MIGLGDLDAGRQALLLLLGERNVLHRLAEAHQEGRDIGVLEHLHLVVADQDGDVGLRLLEHARHLGHGALAGVVALLLDRQLDLLLQVLVGAQLGEFVELERAVAIDQRRIAPVGLDAAAPQLGRRRQQRAMRGAHAEHDLCHGLSSISRSPQVRLRPSHTHSSARSQSADGFP